MSKIIGLVSIGVFGIISIVFFSSQILQRLAPSPLATYAATNATIIGPIVGAVTDTKATVWLRAVIPTGETYKIKVSPTITELNETKISKNSRIGSLAASGPDQTYKSLITNLTPNTVYYVNIFSGTKAKLSVPTKFKTFATPGEAKPFKMIILTDFGTSSPNHTPPSSNVKTFISVSKEKPLADLVFLGGDLWHTNLANTSKTKKEFREKNRDMFKSIYSLNSQFGPYDDFVKFILPNYSLMHVYDDHDLGKNNANKDFPWKKVTLAVLNEYFPTYETSPNGAWQKASYGNTDFLLLDARSQRDDNNDPDDENKSMLDGNNLGPQGQLAWLFNNLKNSTATWKVILSGSPFNPTGMKNDSWAGFKFERQKILDFIHSNKITGVVVISGDEHMGGIDNGTNSGVPEMLVPGPNLAQCSTTNDPGIWSEGTYGHFGEGKNDPSCHGYGMFRVLTNPDRIIMKVNDANGKQQLNLKHFLEPADAAKFASQLSDDE